MKKLIALIICYSLFVPTTQAHSKSSLDQTTLTLASMNLKWYGSSHFPPHNDDERDVHLKKFFKSYYAQVDVFLFQEITDPKRLEKILPSAFKCLTTENRGRGYQYVVACYDAKELRPLNTSTNTFDENRSIDITFNNFGLRNALHLEFQSLKDPKKTLHTINLHLRSKPQNSEFRAQQMAALFDHIQKAQLQQSNLVLAGDLNSFGSHATQREQDDIFYYFEEADKRNLQLYTEFDLPTHLNGRNNRNFDYIIVNNSKWLNSYDMFVACSSKASLKEDSYENAKYFNRMISDHCPISIDIGLNSL